MTDKLIVVVTFASAAEASRVAEDVVRGKLAACVNIIPGVRSCYVWEGKLEWSEEVIGLMKTTQSRYEQLRDRVRELHSYSVPEIVAVPLEAAFQPYADWIDETTKAE